MNSNQKKKYTVTLHYVTNNNSQGVVFNKRKMPCFYSVINEINKKYDHQREILICENLTNTTQLWNMVKRDLKKLRREYVFQRNYIKLNDDINLTSVVEIAFILIKYIKWNEMNAGNKNFSMLGTLYYELN